MLKFAVIFSMLAKTGFCWHEFHEMRNLILSLLCLVALSSPLFFQNNGQVNPNNDPNADDNEDNQSQTDKLGLPRFREAKLAGGELVVALDRISSVSRHKYVLDGALIVDEVTIDTTGQALARFYFITPITSGVPGAAVSQLAGRALGLVDGAARRAGSDLQNMVVKKYPLTTHAKTVECRLLSEVQLNVLFQSAKTAWQTGKGRVFIAR
jgi:hypothetical protein